MVEDLESFIVFHNVKGWYLSHFQCIKKPRRNHVLVLIQTNVQATVVLKMLLVLKLKFQEHDSLESY